MAATIERGIVSTHDRRRPSVRTSLGVLQGGLLITLVVVGLGPILWLAKAAVTPTQETLRQPLGLFPTGIDWANLATAWNRAEIDHYFVNTVIVAAGAWFFQILVAPTGGSVLSVLRPRYGNVIFGLVLAPLFAPSVVLLVPLYLTILDVPIVHVSLLGTFWAVWLPMGASAFNVLVVKRFFDGLPREI